MEASVDHSYENKVNLNGINRNLVQINTFSHSFDNFFLLFYITENDIENPDGLLGENKIQSNPVNDSLLSQHPSQVTER